MANPILLKSGVIGCYSTDEQFVVSGAMVFKFIRFKTKDTNESCIIVSIDQNNKNITDDEIVADIKLMEHYDDSFQVIKIITKELK
ncbi:MAG: hypothetical protein Q4D14_04565 [Bacteroidales bacterium]|nr:hypothetical protein [Bacteroidales bacterium]